MAFFISVSRASLPQYLRPSASGWSISDVLRAGRTQQPLALQPDWKLGFLGTQPNVTHHSLVPQMLPASAPETKDFRR